MKIHICYDIKDTPHGGANQFLKALEKTFEDLLNAVEKVCYNIKMYRKNINIDSMKNVTEKYINFFEELL